MYPVFYKIKAKYLTIFTQYGIQAPNTTEKYPILGFQKSNIHGRYKQIRRRRTITLLSKGMECKKPYLRIYASSIGLDLGALVSTKADL